MKTRLIIILLAIYVSGVFAQNDSISFKHDFEKLNNDISILDSSLKKVQFDNVAILNKISSIEDSLLNLLKMINNQNSDIDSWKEKSNRKTNEITNKLNAFIQKTENYISNQNTKIDSIQDLITINSANIDKTANELGVKIESAEKSTNQSITDLNKTVSQNMLYWIIAVLVVALFVLLVFILLRKQIFKQKSDLTYDLQDNRNALEQELKNTRKKLEDGSANLDNKLIDVIESQLKIISREGKENHNFFLKVAGEIVRIEKNLSKMDDNNKRKKPLIKAIERIKDNYRANKYEIVQLLGKEYNEGMNIEVINFVTDEKIPDGKRIITNIHKPQVNYKSILIQRAQIDVSQL